MSVEIRPVRGPLDDDRLRWITELYGPVDAKYRSVDYIRHQFVDNPFGWAAHVFALEGARPVGHCGVVPFKARDAEKPFVAGKLEALAVAETHRGRRAGDGGSVATDILSTLYPFAVENGMAVLFGLAPPAVARIHVRAGCRQVPTSSPAFTLVADAASFGRDEASRKRRLAARLVGAAQRATVGGVCAAVRLVVRTSVLVGDPTPEDAGLASARAEAGRWTVSGDDAWDWYVGSGVLRALDLAGPSGCRALVRLDKSGETTVQIVGWRPRRPGLLPGVLLLGAASKLARDNRAPTLRFQPWPGDGGNGALARACSLLGFVKRPEADLLLYPPDAGYDRAQLTPFFYVTF